MELYQSMPRAFQKQLIWKPSVQSHPLANLKAAKPGDQSRHGQEQKYHIAPNPPRVLDGSFTPQKGLCSPIQLQKKKKEKKMGIIKIGWIC